MLRRALVPTIALTLAVATAAVATPTARKSPAWISIETPVNPYDASTRGAALLVHADLHGGTPALREVVGSAEGLVGGVRKTIPLRFDTTSRPGVFAVAKQWPSDGAWLLRISLFTTSALVTLDRSGNVAGVTVPTTTASGSSMALPRAVSAREIDAMLASAARQ